MKTFFLGKSKTLLMKGLVFLLIIGAIATIFLKGTFPSSAVHYHRSCDHSSGSAQNAACHNQVKSLSADGKTLREDEDQSFFKHASKRTKPSPTPTSTSASPDSWPTYNPPPRVDPSDSGEDMNFNGGNVIDGTAHVYLIFWIDSAFQPATPTYVSLVHQFIQDVGDSPFYANLLQYPDANGHVPTGVQLAGTFIDTQPFPSQMVADLNNPNADQNALGTLTDHTWKQEIADVSAKEGWDTQDYHNLFIVLPTVNSGCGYHGYLGTDQQKGSPWIYVSYTQNGCGWLQQFPNHDPAADGAISTIGHELIEAVTDPHIDGWIDSGGGEMVDPCPLPSDTIDPQTNGNVTWHGHSYILQEEYDNFRHGCTLEGP